MIKLCQLKYDEHYSFSVSTHFFGGLKDIAGSSRLRESRVNVVYVLGLTDDRKLGGSDLIRGR